MFPGIGPKTAERIYQKFGEKTFEILDQDPEQLLKIKGFTKKQLQAVKEGREDQQGFREDDLPPRVGNKPGIRGENLRSFGMNCVLLLKVTLTN